MIVTIGIGINHQNAPGVSSPIFLVSEELALYFQTEDGNFIVAETSN